MQFIWTHYTLLFNALYLIVNCLICPCKSNGYFGTPPSDSVTYWVLWGTCIMLTHKAGVCKLCVTIIEWSASLSNRAIFTVVGGVTSSSFLWSQLCYWWYNISLTQGIYRKLLITDVASIFWKRSVGSQQIQRSSQLPPHTVSAILGTPLPIRCTNCRDKQLMCEAHPHTKGSCYHCIVNGLPCLFPPKTILRHGSPRIRM